MSNKNFSKKYQENRMILRDVIPLEIPLCISIEASNICNFKCVMCFQGSEKYAQMGKPLKNIDMDCFYKVIQDIKELCKNGEKIKLMKLYSLGEPLLNGNIGEMVQCIKEADICNELEITTNGSLLNEQVAKELIDGGLDYLRISVYSIDEKHNEEITQSKIKPEEIRRNVKFAYDYRNSKQKDKPLICAKMIDTYTDENERFIKYYEGVCDEAYIDKPMNTNTGENVLERLYHDNENYVVEDIMNNHLFKGRKACRYPFTHMTVRSDGGVVVCCSDWMQKTKIGNVYDKSLAEIWNSKEMYDFRCMMLKTKGLGNEICKNCEIPLRGFAEDDIDDFPIEKLSYGGK